MRKHSMAASVAWVGAALVAATAMSAPARADTNPAPSANPALGLWVDHTGRGAIEITECGGKLCGHVAWLKDPQFSDQCGKQIIGNVQPVGKNKWDRGWIFDPERGKKFDVELTLLREDRMRVKGYAGLKWLSESHTWKRAPADMQKCGTADNGETTAAAPAAASPGTDAKSAAAAPVPAPANGASDRAIDQADGSKSDATGKQQRAADGAKGRKSAEAKSANLSPPNVGQNNSGKDGVTILNAPGAAAEQPDRASKQAGTQRDPAGGSRDGDAPRTASRAYEACPGNDQRDNTKSAQRDRERDQDRMARSDELDEYGDESDEPPRRGRVLARLMEKLESGDGPVKLRRSGRNCSVEVPYAGVISFPCERQ